MSLKNLFCIIIIFLICMILLKLYSKNTHETFNSHENESCYTNCRERESSSLTDVCPNKPECVGICINQHTYTDENISEDILKTLDDVGTLKNNQNNADVITTNCGLCIANFYEGLKKMNDLGERCS